MGVRACVCVHGSPCVGVGKLFKKHFLATASLYMVKRDREVIEREIGCGEPKIRLFFLNFTYKSAAVLSLEGETTQLVGAIWQGDCRCRQRTWP